MTLHLRRIELWEIQLPLREPFRISSGVVQDRRILLLHLQNEDGTETWSECVAEEKPNYSEETTDTAWHALTEWLIPRVLGKTFTGPEALGAALNVGIRGHRMAKAALEMGAWDLTARQRNLPLSRMLGGTRDRVLTGISVGIQQTPEVLAQKAVEAVALGYGKVKLKIAPGMDVDFVAAVRDAVGTSVGLAVDANAAYTLADAPHLARLDPFNLLMLEQPLAQDDLLRHAALQKQIATPICLDESITGVQQAEDMITLGSGRIINIKPGRVGGFSASLAIHDIARAHDIPVWCGGMLESGIGRAYNVALASLPGFTLPGDLSPSARYWAADIVTPEWTMEDGGMVCVPLDRPGFGVEVNRNRIDALTTRTAVHAVPQGG
jgi:O-succinylbenzoate synthase